MKKTVVIAAAAVIATQAWLAGSGGDAFAATARGLAAMQIWRMFTGPLLHATWGQLARDVSTFLVLGVVWERALGRRFVPVVLLGLCWPAVAALSLSGASIYFGLSGLVNALFVAVFIHEARRSPLPLWAWGLGAAYAGKLVFETITGHLLMPMSLGADVVAIPLAHVAGAAAGLVVMLGPDALSTATRLSSPVSSRSAGA